MLVDSLDAVVVFSAHAEVVPATPACGLPIAGILRARGGSSASPGPAPGLLVYSPRTRR